MPERLSHYEMYRSLQLELEEIDAKLRAHKKLRQRREHIVSAMTAIEAMATLSEESGGNAPESGIEAGGRIAVGEPLAEVIEGFLREAKRPMHVKELVERLRARGYFIRHPDASVEDAVSQALNRKTGPSGRFIRPAPATYALAGWERERETPSSEDQRRITGTTMSDLILEAARLHPGRRSVDLADLVLPLVKSHTTSEEPRKVVLTLIGQLVSQGRLFRDQAGRTFIRPQDGKEGDKNEAVL